MENLQKRELFGVFERFKLNEKEKLQDTGNIKIERELWLKQHSEPYSDDEWIEYNKLFSERIQYLLDAGSGSCILKNILLIIQNNLAQVSSLRKDEQARCMFYIKRT